MSEQDQPMTFAYPETQPIGYRPAEMERHALASRTGDTRYALLVRDEWTHNRREVSDYWIIVDHRGWGGGADYDSLDAARADFEEHDRINAATHGLAASLSRQEYEAACVAAGQDPLSDTDCDSYGVTYGDFQRPAYSVEHIIAMALARRRLHAIEQERAAKRRALPRREPEMVACPNCGMQTPKSLLVSASLGTACPECFDSLSD